MSNLEDSLIDNQAALQRQIRELRREIVCLAIAGLALTVVCGILAARVYLADVR